MTNYIMNRESLKRHCEKMCKIYGDAPSSNAYMEHKLVLDLLEQTRWIPVSERLPETDGVYLTYIVNPYDSQLSYVMLCDYIGQTWCPVDETASNNVVAWMPLPEPCKAESEEVYAESNN